MERVIEAVREVLDDSALPKATRIKLEEIVVILEAPGDIRLRVNKAICEIEEGGIEIQERIDKGVTLKAFVK